MAFTNSELSNLPQVTLPLVGRDLEIAEISAALSQSDQRLITLVGPPGTGKTRLAIAIAHVLDKHFANGVHFVDLAAVDTPDLVISTFAHELGLRPMGERPLLHSLAVVLRDQELLVVLDNFEQALAAGSQILDLLVACPHLRVLVTSREPLHLVAENLIEVRPLAVPDLDHLPEDLALLERIPSVRLLCLRARLVAPAFELTHQNARAVAEVCVRLDGLPLAIELAAAFSNVLPPRALLAQLDHGLQLLVAEDEGGPVRHRALQVAIAVSYDRLLPEEQTLFRRLAVFAGGCSPETALAVFSRCSDELELASMLRAIGTLADKHLLQVMELTDGAPRYSLLETVRQFAWERLSDAGEIDMVRHSHAVTFCELAEHAERELTGADQHLWLDLLERERDNLRSAISWAQKQSESGEPHIGLRLVGALWFYWDLRGHVREGRTHTERMIRYPSAQHTGTPYAGALLTAGWLAWVMSDYATSSALLKNAYAAAEASGNLAHQARALVIEALGVGNTSAMHDPDARTRARSMYERSEQLGQIAGDLWSVGFSLYGLGHLAELDGNRVRAQQFFDEAYRFCEQLGSRWGMSFAQFRRGLLALRAGATDLARLAFTDSVRLSLAIDDPRSLSLPLVTLAVIESRDGQPELATRLLGAAESQRQAADYRMPPYAQALHDQTVAQIKEHLDPAVFTAAWAAGHATPREGIESLLADQDGAVAQFRETGSRLSARERQVIRLIANGLTNRQIAQGLGITDKTVNAHVERIYRKLGIRSRAQAAAWAVHHSLAHTT